MTRTELVRLRDRLDLAVEIATGALGTARRTRLELMADTVDLGGLIVAAREGHDLVQSAQASLDALEAARRDVEVLLVGMPGLRVVAAKEG